MCIEERHTHDWAVPKQRVQISKLLSDWTRPTRRHTRFSLFFAAMHLKCLQVKHNNNNNNNSGM
jgi:hypothetical protein